MDSIIKLVANNFKDWRVVWIICSIGVAIVLTALAAYFFPSIGVVDTFQGAFFASWVAGLLLTSVITLVFAIVTLARPENDVFEARARNLLRGQSGPHIDYIVGELQRLLEPYFVNVTRVIEVTEYDEKSNCFRINQKTKSQLKAYLNDGTVTFASKLAYTSGTPAPKGFEQCSLTYLKVNNEEILGNEYFDDQIIKPFEVRVKPDAICSIEHRMVYWVKSDEEKNRHKPNRYTLKMNVIVKNSLPSRKVFIKQFDDKCIEKQNFEILAGQEEIIVDLSELIPGEFVYDFRISDA